MTLLLGAGYVIVNAVVSSAWEFHVTSDSQAMSEAGPLFGVPAGTVLPYVGLHESGGVVAVLVNLDSPTICYLPRNAGYVARCSVNPT